MFEQYDDVLTVEEACEALKVGRNSLYGLLKDKILVGYRVGKHWRISKLSLINYILGRSRIG